MTASSSSGSHGQLSLLLVKNVSVLDQIISRLHFDSRWTLTRDRSRTPPPAPSRSTADLGPIIQFEAQGHGSGKDTDGAAFEMLRVQGL